MFLYNLKLKFYYFLEKFEYSYCTECDEILVDNECDYCDNNF